VLLVRLTGPKDGLSGIAISLNTTNLQNNLHWKAGMPAFLFSLKAL